MKGEHLSEDFQKVSIAQTIPTLVHNSLVLYESHAIMTYLSSAFNVKSTWYPDDLILRAQVDCYLHWHHMHIRLGCALYLQNKYLSPMVYGRELADIEMLTSQVREDSFWMLQQILGEFPYVARTQFPTIADLSCYSELIGMKWAGFDFSKFDKISIWMTRMGGIPEVKNCDRELFKFTARFKI